MKQALAKNGTHSVAGCKGLYLAVKGGSRRWVYRYKVPGIGKNGLPESKLKELPLASYAVKSATRRRISSK